MRNRFWWGDSGSFNLAHLQGLQLFPALLCIVISGYLSVLAQSITQDGPSGVWSDGGPGSVSTGLSRTGKGEKPQKTRPDRCRAAAQRTEGGHPRPPAPPRNQGTEGGHRSTAPRPAQKPADRGWTPSHGPVPRPETSRPRVDTVPRPRAPPRNQGTEGGHCPTAPRPTQKPAERHTGKREGS